MEDTSIVEIIDFKKFPHTQKHGAIGMVFGKVVNGLSTNFFSELVYPFHLNEEGLPTVSLEHALAAIRYSVCSEIFVALRYLQGNGWFDEKVRIWIDGLEPFDEIRLEGWSENWDTGAKVDVAFFLEDVCKELELDGRAFSQEWYYAKVSHHYFSDIEVPDVAMTVGILLSQMWWKLDQEEAALRGNANIESLERATNARRLHSRKQTEAKINVIASLWKEAAKDLGAELMRRDSNAAQAIYAIAVKKRPIEMQLKSTGEIIGVDAIRKRLPGLRKLGKIG